uniref:C2H2-type domain-containing protein n=1 Tax=Glossina brevipalpis TaxID=37001 RepID=A0A1A9W6M7_9MUSC
MKEEAETNRKLPPKLMGGGTLTGTNTLTTNTPSKQQSDEILSTLLRMSNFDSISSIKDESLDIDLSACVTITADPSGIIGGNSLSSLDFWRVLDESAQTTQLDNGISCSNSNKDRSSSPSASGIIDLTSDFKNELKEVLKKQQTDFSGTFLRPEAPSSTGTGFSPLKRSVKPVPSEQIVKFDMQQLRDKSPTGNSMKLEGIPWLAPIYIQSIPKTTIESNITKNTEPLSKVAHIKKEINIIRNPSTPPPLVILENVNQDIPKSTAELLYQCLDCEGNVFQDTNELSKHTNHRINYKCSECEKEFDLETSLKKHLKTHRPLDARKDAWKKCPDCGKCLKLGSMWMHRKIHAENKKYGCDICGQKFVQKINLTHHTRVHTAEKPYECSECQKRFQERSHLQRHQKYHAQTRSYRCDKCGKMYKTERCLKVHNLVHLEQRPFACTVCDKSFISNSKLKQHSNIHTGERPFKCNYCPRDFTNFPNWLKHTRRRHKVDHKTGEMLENIPSYCSKKSTRTPKEKKNNEITIAVTTATTTETVSTSGTYSDSNKTTQKINQKDNTDLINPDVKQLAALNAINNTISITASNSDKLGTSAPPLAKMATKRKKKLSAASEIELKQKQDGVLYKSRTATPQTNITLATTGGPPPLTLVFNAKHLNPPTSITINKLTKTTVAPAARKPEKAKRERKQSMPKQVQQVPPPLLIKKEFVEPNIDLKTCNISHPNAVMQQNQAKANFPDLHCLSITSAEELIMEQALEMEECGLYKAPTVGDVMVHNFADTDNAISSEAVADLHFKIKQEHDFELKLKSEDLDSLKKNMCSSLESSPFSSPASMEFASSSSLLNTTTADFVNSNFYLPSFSISNQVVSNDNSKIEQTLNSSITTELPQLIATNISVPQLIQIDNRPSRSNNQTIVSSPKQTIINQVYLPLAVNASPTVIMKSNQALPSVDTLLFSHSKLGIFNGRSLTKQVSTAQHNLS